MKEFMTRTITAFCLIIPAYLLIAFLPPVWFSVLLYLLISAAAYELVRLAQPVLYSLILMFLNGAVVALSFTIGKPELLPSLMIILMTTGIFYLLALRQRRLLTSFIRDIAIHYLVIFYIYIPLYFLLKLKEMSPNHLFFLLVVIAIGDTGAYFVGSAIGKHKIYPVASPNKSLEGLIAAGITAGGAAWVSLKIFSIDVNVWYAVWTGVFIGLLSQVSDPIESLFKRAAGKKDSGSILPGHGGVLDRVDSYIFCAPALFYIIQYLWK